MFEDVQIGWYKSQGRALVQQPSLSEFIIKGYLLTSNLNQMLNIYIFVMPLQMQSDGYALAYCTFHSRYPLHVWSVLDDSVRRSDEDDNALAGRGSQCHNGHQVI